MEMPDRVHRIEGKGRRHVASGGGIIDPGGANRIGAEANPARRRDRGVRHFIEIVRIEQSMAPQIHGIPQSQRIPKRGKGLQHRQHRPRVIA